MSYYDGGVLGAWKIHDAGDAADRFNLAIMSEGYRYDQLYQFVADAKAFVDRLFSTPPFNTLKCRINVYRVDVWSYQEGADDPNVPGSCNGTGASARTYFDATFCSDGIERLIGLSDWMVEWVRAYWLPQAHEIVMLVNSRKEGGNGYKYATVSTGNGWDWTLVALHEMGHLFGLGDEYDYLTRCDDGNTVYAGDPPDWPNVAQDVSRPGIKWAKWVKAATPLPTSNNPNCATCTTGATGYPPGTVGAFEGAGLYHCGLYRPEENCLMRYSTDFCQVCGDVIAGAMAPFAPTCLAPVFDASSGITCLIKKMLWALIAVLLAPTTWHPAGDCAYRRFVFRAQHCETGNSNPCTDLGGTGTFPSVPPIGIPYPRPASKFGREADAPGGAD